MSTFGIPSGYREPLLTLARIGDAQYDALIASLDALPSFAPVDAIRQAAHGAFREDPALAEQVVPPLLALRGQIRGMTSDQLADALSRSPDLDLDQAGRSALKTRATAILSTEAVSTTGIAVDLQTQHPRNFKSARVFTDIRPVFRDDVDERPAGAVLSATLQLGTWDRDGHSESIFVALDESDLEQLQVVIERALKKTRTIRTLLEEQGLSYFELDMGD